MAKDASLGTAKAEPLGPSLWLVELAGEHDLTTAPLVDAAFAQIASGTTVVVEFTHSSFIDSTVAGALVKRSRGGETLVLVVPMGSAVRRTLDMIGTTGLFRTFETRDEALRAIPPEGMLPATRDAAVDG